MSNEKMMRVLLVEDNNELMELAKICLEDIGCEVITACNGNEGLKLFTDENGNFQLIVSDFEMPVMNGLQMISEIRKGSDIPIALWTGRSKDPGCREKFTSSGANWIVDKTGLVEFIKEVKNVA